MSTPLTLLTWNLGYAGLGKAAEFIADGGQRLRVEAPEGPRRWMQEIARFAASRTEDLLLFQEAAKPSWVNHGCDLWGALRGALAPREHAYAHEFRIPLPFGAGAETACALFHRALTDPIEDRRRLPSDGPSLFRQYPALMLRFLWAGAPFTTINAHLSAFDAGARLRSRQLQTLLAIAGTEYAAGRHVVIGADFNYELAPSPRPHTTAAEHMGWLHPFPANALAAGWRIAADPKNPTFRSNDKPYVPGENYAGIIDGFIVSPNVRVAEVAAIDLGFEASDHNPVRISVLPADG